MLQLSGKYPEKRLFITGAASGLGFAFCQHFAKDGWTIGMSDIQAETLATAAKEIEATGATVFQYILDVSDKVAYEKVRQDYLNDVGGIDVLINNAGVGDGSPFHQYPLEDWEWMTGINQMGVLYGCHLFALDFLSQKKGHVINIASAAAYANAPGMGPYNMTKAAVYSLSETLFYEWSPLGIQISVVMPTFFKTNIMQYARGSKEALKSAEKLVTKSKYKAENISLEILEKAGKGKFEILLPKESRIGYRMKRWFPSIFRKQLFRLAAKQMNRKK